MFRHTLIAFSVALATSAFGTTLARAGNPNSQDKDFVMQAASAGMLEVRLGQYASENAADIAVKHFGEQMVNDHTKANDELKTIAIQDQLDVPKELSDDDKKVLDRLEKLNGAEFDKEYAKQMVKDHKKVIKLFQKEADEGQDDQLKNFASNTLAVLKHHLSMAEELAGKVG